MRRLSHLTKAGALTLLLFLVAGTAISQDNQLPQSPVLTVLLSDLYNGTALGQRLSRDLDAQEFAYEEENRILVQKLEAEEAALAELRPEITRDEFQVKAEAFNVKVQEIRTQRATHFQRLNEYGQQLQKWFGTIIRPVLEDIMVRRGASMILSRDAVLVPNEAFDITLEAIDEIDRRFGAGEMLDSIPQFESFRSE